LWPPWLGQPDTVDQKTLAQVALRTDFSTELLLARRISKGPDMQIWVDADGCPSAIKEILFRAADRTGVLVTFVANQPVRVPPSPFIKTLQVSKGFDVADNEIVRRLGTGDLVITSDIPLAAETIDKGGQALSPRGELFTKENIRGRLNMRDFLDTLRASGIDTGGPPPLGQGERKAFAGHLDRLLAHRASNR